MRHGLVHIRYSDKRLLERILQDVHETFDWLTMPGYSSGQRGQTVNLLASAYVGSSPTPGTRKVI